MTIEPLVRRHLSPTGDPSIQLSFHPFHQEASDTLDLIDQLLWALGPADSGEAGFVFFDLDETLITRDTCLVDGLGSTRLATDSQRRRAPVWQLLLPIPRALAASSETCTSLAPLSTVVQLK